MQNGFLFGMIDMRFRLVLTVVANCVLVVLAVTERAAALDGKVIVESECASCHNITGPAPGTFAELLARKAPDLYYAGSKFYRPWLARWLQNPTVIRRSGVIFLNHIVNKDGKDRVNEATVSPCAAKLGVEETEAVADYLMTLTDPTMKTGIVDATKKHSKHKAYNLFSKRMPCIGCHRITFAKKQRGGISGPDLTNAGERLNPDWIYARIENPQYWDAKTWMPKLEMSHKKRALLTQFLASMR